METSEGFEIRCGEVFITRQKFFNFHCLICHSKYEDFSALLDHISENHFANIVWSTDEIENKSEYFQESKIEWDEQSEEQNVDIKSEIDEEVNDVFEIEYSQDEAKNNFDDHQKEKLAAQYNDSEPRLKQRERLELKNHNCTICEKVFRTKSNLKAHLAQKHSDERNFKCDKCDWAFKRSSGLRSHQRRHELSRNFSCSFCTKKFKTSDEVRTHERIHTGEKPFVCAKCGKAFITSGLLTNHMKRHNNDRRYKCEHCEKTFYSAQHWKCHIVVHTGERQHICDVCHAAFSRRKTLLQHMKIHINARENKCDICDAAFNQKPALVAHMKTKHKVLSIGSKSDLPQTCSFTKGLN